MPTSDPTITTASTAPPKPSLTSRERVRSQVSTSARWRHTSASSHAATTAPRTAPPIWSHCGTWKKNRKMVATPPGRGGSRSVSRMAPAAAARLSRAAKSVSPGAPCWAPRGNRLASCAVAAITRAKLLHRLPVAKEVWLPAPRIVQRTPHRRGYRGGRRGESVDGLELLDVGREECLGQERIVDAVGLVAVPEAILPEGLHVERRPPGWRDARRGREVRRVIALDECEVAGIGRERIDGLVVIRIDPELVREAGDGGLVTREQLGGDGLASVTSAPRTGHERSHGGRGV